MKKLTYFLLLLPMLVIVYAFGTASVKCADAKLWTSSMMCPNTEAKGKTVEQIIKENNYTVTFMSSVDIKFNVQVTGTITPDTKLWAQVGTKPADDATCSDVKCLRRYQEQGISITSTSFNFVLNEIGCSDPNGCRQNGQDLIPISAYLTGSDNKLESAPSNCTTTITGTQVSNGKLNITDGNGQPRDVKITIACTEPTPTLTPAPAVCVLPKPTVVITCPGGGTDCQ